AGRRTTSTEATLIAPSPRTAARRLFAGYAALISRILTFVVPRSGRGAARRLRPLRLRGFDLQDLELRGAARGSHFDDVALLVAHDGLPDGGLVRELVLGRVRLGGADDVVLERLLRVHVPDADLRTDRDGVLGDLLLRDHAG